MDISQGSNLGYRMDVINRAVAIIKPKQPYLDWANSLPDTTDPVTLAALRRDCTALLIPEHDDPAEAEAFITDIYAAIFELELDAWHRDPAAWPAQRTYQAFQEWFDVDIHSLVLDAADDRMQKEAY
jgi:hypothetical protein